MFLKFSINGWSKRVYIRLLTLLSLKSESQMARVIRFFTYRTQRLKAFYRRGLKYTPAYSILFKKHASIFFFIALLKHLRKVISLFYIRNSVSLRPRLHRFLYSLIWNYWYFTLFLHMRNFFDFVFSLFIFFSNFNVSFFALSNESINARFMSRYIARKLKQNYNVRHLLSDLRNELHLVNFLTKCKLSSAFIRKTDALQLDMLNNKKGVFKKIIMVFFTIYSKFYLNYYHLLKSWISLDSLLIFNRFSKLNLKFNFLIGFSAFFFKNRCFFNLFFFNKDYLKKNLMRDLILPESKILFINDLNLIRYVKFFFNDFYLNFNTVFLWSYSFNFNLFIFRASNLNLNRFLSYNYWNLRSGILNASANLNFKTARGLRLGILGHLAGFKIHCVGRFSRKQRAGSVWFRDIKVPLNTLSALIDYGFFTIPLRNSAISVKVWLYKTSHQATFYLRVF